MSKIKTTCRPRWNLYSVAIWLAWLFVGACVGVACIAPHADQHNRGGPGDDNQANGRNLGLVNKSETTQAGGDIRQQLDGTVATVLAYSIGASMIISVLAVAGYAYLHRWGPTRAAIDAVKGKPKGFRY